LAESAKAIKEKGKRKKKKRNRETKKQEELKGQAEGEMLSRLW